MSRFTLPPAVYKIKSDTTFVTDPDADNDTLTLKVDGSDQLWLISGDGIIRSLAHDRKFASARLAPKTSGIIRSSSSLKWIIALTTQTANGGTGTIRADDGTRRFWQAVTGNPAGYVILGSPGSTGTSWTFERQDDQ